MKLTVFEHPSGDRPLAALGLLLMGVFALALQDSLAQTFGDDPMIVWNSVLQGLGVPNLTVADNPGLPNYVT